MKMPEWARVDERVAASGFGQAVRALPTLDGCADAAALRAPIRAPADPKARARVASIQRELAAAKALQRAGKYAEATDWVSKHWLGREQECYQPLGGLFLKFGDRKVSEYRREAAKFWNAPAEDAFAPLPPSRK